MRTFFILICVCCFVISCDVKSTQSMTCSPPVFLPPAGDYNQSQLVSIDCATEGAQIRYTLDGTNPPANSLIYIQPFLVSRGTTVKAQSYKANWSSSSIVSAFYSGVTPNPVILLSPGTYFSGTKVSFVIDSEDEEIECNEIVFKYTLDGTEPNASSQSIGVSPDYIVLTQSCTIQVKTFYRNWNPSSVVIASFTIIPGGRVATPTFSVAGGNYITTQVVSIACTTADAAIRYTTNGTEPDSTSTLNVGPITVATDVTIKAKGFKAGWNPSFTASETYLILSNQMVSVPGGSFSMGRTLGGTGYNDELPTHTVTLSPFYISRYEVKQSEWISVMGSNPSNFTGDLNRPVEKVSWYAALVYCNKRSIAEGLTPAYTINGSTNPTVWGTIPATNNATWNNVVCDWGANGYRLPTEAEWEFAARGGVATPDYLYSGSNTVGDVAWYQTNSGDMTHTVGQKIANGLGLYDMSGNVQEWVWDWYGLYSSSSATNPTGPLTGTYRGIRGGSFNSKGVYTPGSTDVRLVFRNYATPEDSESAKGEAKVYNERLGFRVVRSSM